MYHYIVDKYHAMMSDEDLMAAIIATRPKKAWAKASPGARTVFLHLCLDAHHENRALYLGVMTGRIG